MENSPLKNIFGTLATNVEYKPPPPPKSVDLSFGAYFKIVCTGKEFYNLLDKAILQELCGASELLFQKEQMLMSSTDGVYGCFGSYKPEFFMQYESKNDPIFKFNRLFLKTFKTMNFATDEKLIVESDYPNNRLHIIGSDRVWYPQLISTDIDTVGFPDDKNQIVFVEGLGYLPKLKEKNKPLFQTTIPKLHLPKLDCETVTIIPTKTSLKFVWDYDGELEINFDLDPDKTVLFEPEQKPHSFINNYLSKYLSAYDDTVVLFLYNGMAIFVEHRELYSYIMFLSTIQK